LKPRVRVKVRDMSLEPSYQATLRMGKGMSLEIPLVGIELELYGDDV